MPLITDVTFMLTHWKMFCQIQHHRPGFLSACKRTPRICTKHQKSPRDGSEQEWVRRDNEGQGKRRPET